MWLPQDSGVDVVAGCSGIGGEVEAVLERGVWGACRCGEKGVGMEGVGCPRWVMRACAEGVIRYRAGV